MPGTCTITGTEGENPDDCTTHDHEKPIYCDLPDDHEGVCQDRYGHRLYYAPGTFHPWTLSGEMAEGWRECDDCGRTTEAGAWPDWINGSCEDCDPDILDDPENIRTGAFPLTEREDPIIKVTYQATMLICKSDLEQLDRERGFIDSSDFYALTYDGPAIGMFTDLHREQLFDGDVEAELVAIGNDGTFFGELDDE